MNLLPSSSMPAGVRGAAGSRREWPEGAVGGQRGWRAGILDAPAVICSLWGRDHERT